MVQGFHEQSATEADEGNLVHAKTYRTCSPVDDFVERERIWYPCRSARPFGAQRDISSFAEISIVSNGLGLCELLFINITGTAISQRKQSHGGVHGRLCV